MPTDIGPMSGYGSFFPKPTGQKKGTKKEETIDSSSDGAVTATGIKVAELQHMIEDPGVASYGLKKTSTSTGTTSPTEYPPPPKVQPKHVIFKLLPPKSSELPQSQIELNIFPHATVNFILAHVTGFYGLYESRDLVFLNQEFVAFIPSYENLTNNMTVHVRGKDSVLPKEKEPYGYESEPENCGYEPDSENESKTRKLSGKLIKGEDLTGRNHLAHMRPGVTSHKLNMLPAPLPSDSGYHSGLGTDTMSVCSVDSMGSSLGLPKDFLQEFIAFFGDALIEKSAARQWASYVLAIQSKEHIAKGLSTLLKDYAVELASELRGSQPFKGSNESPPLFSKQSHQVLASAAGIVRCYRYNIARYFYENAVSSPPNAVSLSVRLQNLGQQLSLTERFGLLTKPGPNTIDPEEVAERTTPPSETQHDEHDVELFKKLEPIRDRLICSDVFGRMASKIREQLYHDDMREMDNIRLTVALKRFRCSFRVDWSPANYMRAQYGENFPSIGEVIAITGSVLYAQATTCKEYIKQTWPSSGTFLVQALDAFLNPDISCAHADDCKYSLTLKAQYAS
jgi:hypothetical protein